MTASLAKRLAELETMNTAALQNEWRRLFRSQPPSLSRDLLMRAIGHRYQEIAFGGLGKAAARKLRALADAAKAPTADAAASSAGDDRRGTARTVLMPGARLVREWHGQTHSVTVTDTGFDYAGRSYRSLTEIAREITGTHWSGPRFFGIGAAHGKAGGVLGNGKLAASPVPRPSKVKGSRHS